MIWAVAIKWSIASTASSRIAHLTVRGAEQGVTVGENPADKIGVAAGCHGHLRRLLNDGHLRFRIKALGSGRGFGTGRRTSDDYNLLAHDSNPHLIFRKVHPMRGGE